MKLTFIYRFVGLAALLSTFVMTSCGSQEDALPQDVAEAALFLNIEPIGQTRAGTADLSSNEKMHSVRIVVLHQDGTVEHNKLYSVDAPNEQKLVLLKVKPNEDKKIFLFANEESVDRISEGETSAIGTLTAFFDKYKEGEPGFEDKVNTLYFAPDYSDNKPIPMSSSYVIKKDEFTAGTRVNKEFYVVRVATKFTVNFFNRWDEEITVNSFSIASYADKNFLMAHVKSYPNTEKYPQSRYPTWIEWLKKVSEDSSERDGSDISDAAGWLTDYELPAQATNNTYTYTSGPITIGASPKGSETPVKAGVSPVFYLPESKNLKDGATDGEQEYTMTLDIEGHGVETFTLPNLKSLFRNTHVVVNVTMFRANYEFKVVVDVQPFAGVDLNPAFGLDRDKDGNLINHRNDDGTYVVEIDGAEVRRDADGDIVIRNFIDGSLFCLQVVFKDYIHDDSEVDYIYPIEKDAAGGNQVILRQKSDGGTFHGMDGLLDWLKTDEGKKASIPDLLKKVNELDKVNEHVHDDKDRPLFVLDKEGHFQYVTYDDEGKPSLSPNDKHGDEILQVNGYQFRNVEGMKVYLGTYLVRRKDNGETELRKKDGTTSDLAWPVSL